jgi:tRNA G10  N-methylase Trm11
MTDLKRKRVVPSIQQKLEIIEQLEKSRNAKQLALQFGIGEQTVRDLEKKKNNVISFAASSSSSGMTIRKTMKVKL